jgi:hypothetical protein
VIPARVVARREEIWLAALQGLAMHGAEPRTLLHSDVHLGNWYVTNAGRMGLCGRVSVRDIGRVTSPTPCLRR